MIAHKPRAARAQSRSMITLQPSKTGVGSGRTTDTQSPMLGAGSGPAIDPWSSTTGALLPNLPTLFKEPHTRTNITSHANGEDGSHPTYSRVPLHLTEDTTDTKTQTSRTDVQSSTSTFENDKANADKIVTSNRAAGLCGYNV